MGDLGYAVQRKSVPSIKVAVLYFVKEGIHPIQTHRTVRTAKQRNINLQSTATLKLRVVHRSNSLWVKKSNGILFTSSR